MDHNNQLMNSTRIIIDHQLRGTLAGERNDQMKKKDQRLNEPRGEDQAPLIGILFHFVPQYQTFNFARVG